MDAIDPEMRDEMMRYMSKELKAVREQLEEERRKTRASGTPAVIVKEDDVDVTELREENEAQQKRLEVLEEENARLWHHVARFESGEEDKPIALDISRSDDRHGRLFELYYMPKDQYEAHCTKLAERLKAAKTKRDVAREEANAAKETATQADDNARSHLQKYKDLKHETKEVRSRLTVAQTELENSLQRIEELEKSKEDLANTVAAAQHKPTPRRFGDVSLFNHDSLEELVDGGLASLSLVNEKKRLYHFSECRLPQRDNGRSLIFPENFKRLLRERHEPWSVLSVQFSSYFDNSFSHIVFLAPSHELSVRADGGTMWRTSPLGTFDTTNRFRQIFFKSSDSWKYLGLHRLAFFGELQIEDLKALPGLNAKTLASKCTMNKSLLPPMIVRQAHQLIEQGAIRVLCFAFEKVEDDGGMSDALRTLPGASHQSQSASVGHGHPKGAGPQAGGSGKRTFSGPPTPIPKPGQSSSVPPTSKNHNKRPHKDSEVSASGPKNKKQKTKNNT